MLPFGFHWRSVACPPEGKNDSVFCDGIQVLTLSQRINDGGWSASVDSQRPERTQWTFRECSSMPGG